jgi:hypothetical protein
LASHSTEARQVKAAASSTIGPTTAVRNCCIAAGNFSRYLDEVFELAKVMDAHSHRFGDTFAVSLLENGVSIENVTRGLTSLGKAVTATTMSCWRPHWPASARDHHR